MSVFADNHSLSKNGPDDLEFRLLFDYRKPIKDVDGFGDVRSAAFPVQVDCTKSKMRKLGLVAFAGSMGQGRSMSRDGLDGWEQINKKHMLFDFVSMLCHDDGSKNSAAN